MGSHRYNNEYTLINLKRHKDKCKPWDPIGITNEYTLINLKSIKTNVNYGVPSVWGTNVP